MPNLKNSYVYGLVTIHWLVSRFCVFVSIYYIICMACDSLSYLFYRREPGTSGESDVSTGLHMGIVQSFIREHHLSALCVIFEVTEDSVPYQAQRKETPI